MAYIRTEEVREIRNALKERFGKEGLKFSVSQEDHTSVHVSIMKGNRDFSDIAPSGYQQINHYHLDLHADDHEELFREILDIIRKAPANAENGREWFDKSDAQTDYFHTAFYININIGKWDKPYQKV